MDTQIKELMHRIMEANKSWRSRVRSEVHDFHYDHKGDILYIAYGKPREAFSVPIDEGEDDIYLRIDPESYEIVGLDIMNFREVFLKHHQDALQAFGPFFEFLGASDWAFQVKLPLRAKGDIALHNPLAQASLDYFPNYLPGIAPDLVPA